MRDFRRFSGKVKKTDKTQSDLSGLFPFLPMKLPQKEASQMLRQTSLFCCMFAAVDGPRRRRVHPLQRRRLAPGSRCRKAIRRRYAPVTDRGSFLIRSLYFSSAAALKPLPRVTHRFLCCFFVAGNNETQQQQQQHSEKSKDKSQQQQQQSDNKVSSATAVLLRCDRPSPAAEVASVNSECSQHMEALENRRHKNEMRADECCIDSRKLSPPPRRPLFWHSSSSRTSKLAN